jgi:hypothetical protein
MSIGELYDFKGVIWDDNIRKEITGPNVLLWHTLEELSSMLELYIPLDALEEIAAKAVEMLEGGQEYFRDLRVPRPHATELVLLRLERFKAGLDPDGE